MKTFLQILFFVYALQINAQGLDGNGRRFPGHGLTFPAPELQRSSSIPYADAINSIVYDSVRVLSELNVIGEADAYSWLSADGLRLYYTSGSPANHIMFAERLTSNSFFNAPVALSISLSPATSIWLSDDELDAYVSNGGTLYYSHRATTNSSFTTMNPLQLSGISTGFISAASLDSSQNELFLYSNNAGSSILEFTRTSPSGFNYVRSLTFPSGYTPTPGQLSKDNLSFFVGAFTGAGTSQLYQFTRAVATDSFSVNTFQPISGIGDTAYWEFQPSASSNANLLAFTKAASNSWSADELYIASGEDVLAVFSPEEKQIVSVFPNPSDGIFHLTFPTKEALNVEVFTLTGIRIYQVKTGSADASLNLNLSSIPKGLYFCRISSDTKKSQVVKLVLN